MRRWDFKNARREDITGRETSSEEFPSPLTPRGPHHGANYRSHCCANAAKAPRLRSRILFSIDATGSCVAARGSAGALERLPRHSASLSPGLSLNVAYSIQNGLFTFFVTAQAEQRVEAPSRNRFDINTEPNNFL